MAAGLPRDFVARRPSRLARSAPETFLGNSSYRGKRCQPPLNRQAPRPGQNVDGLLSARFRRQMAIHSVADLLTKGVQRVRLRKIDSPKARAVKPPSAASSITKMISFMCSNPKPVYKVSAIPRPLARELSAINSVKARWLQRSFTFSTIQRNILARHRDERQGSRG